LIKIAIASGKGGTGKTTLAVNLAKIIAERSKVVLYDLDVEEPNCNLFLKMTEFNQVVSNRQIPALNKDKCTYCGICSQKC
jgi:MinD superfamily P-loop ATPase